MTNKEYFKQVIEAEAPVFAKVVGRALRLMAVAPDEPVQQPTELRTASIR